MRPRRGHAVIRAEAFDHTTFGRLDDVERLDSQYDDRDQRDNRDYAFLSKMVKVIQKIAATIKSMCKEKGFADNELDNELRDGFGAYLDACIAMIEMTRDNDEFSDEVIGELIGLLDNLNKQLAEIGFEIEKDDQFVPLLTV